MFRRSGSIATFFVEGRTPDPHGDQFLRDLEKQRFRTIENAASEETSVGWVTQADPTGDSFDLPDLEFEDAIWLRMRIDKKVLPAKWVQIHRAVAEKAKGSRLSVGERRELREDLMRTLLPRVLPSVNLVDAVLWPKRKMVLLSATSNAAKDNFTALFHRTFGVSLAAADPERLAQELPISAEQRRYLEEVRPVDWLRLDVAPPPRRETVTTPARSTTPATPVATDDMDHAETEVER